MLLPPCMFHDEPMSLFLHRLPETTNSAPRDFKMVLNVGQFKPEELQVTLDGHSLTVSGTHSESKDDSSFESSFTRKIRLPKGIDTSTVHSRINEHGHLELTAQQAKAPEGISIPINREQPTEEAKQ